MSACPICSNAREAASVQNELGLMCASCQSSYRRTRPAAGWDEMVWAAARARRAEGVRRAAAATKSSSALRLRLVAAERALAAARELRRREVERAQGAVVESDTP